MDYHGMRIIVTPRRLRDGAIVYGVEVTDGFYKPIWSYTVTSHDDAVRAAQRWIDGTDRSAGFTHEG